MGEVKVMGPDPVRVRNRIGLPATSRRALNSVLDAFPEIGPERLRPLFTPASPPSPSDVACSVVKDAKREEQMRRIRGRRERQSRTGFRVINVAPNIARVWTSIITSLTAARSRSQRGAQ